MPKLSHFHSCLLECTGMKPPNSPSPPPTTTQQILPMTMLREHRRKKRSKLARISDPTNILQPKAINKSDPAAAAAAKITRPCTECGKRFWSWKALFGHMRCHPERQWRGINPPPNLRRPFSDEASPTSTSSLAHLTAVEQEVATCLVMLANGPSAGDSPRLSADDHDVRFSDGFTAVDGEALGTCDVDSSNCRFECSSCKRVFGSHQALGGHRATHKNVKGCFASAKDDERVGDGEDDRVEGKMGVVEGHKCSICMKVFSSGQALGGHKRCHLERLDDEQGIICSSATKGCGLDLNLPPPPPPPPAAAPTEAEAGPSSSSDLFLGLQLGL